MLNCTTINILFAMTLNTLTNCHLSWDIPLTYVWYLHGITYRLKFILINPFCEINSKQIWNKCKFCRPLISQLCLKVHWETLNAKMNHNHNACSANCYKLNQTWIRLEVVSDLTNIQLLKPPFNIIRYKDKFSIVQSSKL